MLPLVHMHQMVQTPPHLDPLASFPAHRKPDYLSLHHANRPARASNSYQAAGASHRVFPIRSSQAAPSIHPRLITTFGHGPSSDHNEHQLRRKTPNGTIDAGYDGSPAGLAAGPPPLKQLIVPASTKIFPTAVVNRDGVQPNNLGPLSVAAPGWAYSSQALDGGLGIGIGGLDASAVASPWGLGQDMVSPNANAAPIDRASLHQAVVANPYNHAARIQTVFAPTYQQSPGPTAFNPAGFNPPPVWRDNAMSEYRAQVPLSNLGYIPQNAAFDNAYMAHQPMMHHGIPTAAALGHTPQFGMQMSPLSLSDGFALPPHSSSLLHSPHRRMESLSLNATMAPAAGLATCETSSPARFKERALAHAHKTYQDLLVYLNHTKKTSQGKPVSGLRTSSKMVVFPKPPKQPSTALSPPQHKASHSFSQHMAAYGHGSIQGAANVSRAAESITSGSVNIDGVQRLGASTVVAEVFGNPSLQKYPYVSRPQRLNPMGHDIASALSNAKTSLEMLSNLCEQSGWEWVDGMLLGGCLHYGLEHYEDALEWFKRIIGLEPRYVEQSNKRFEIVGDLLTRHQSR